MKSVLKDVQNIDNVDWTLEAQLMLSMPIKQFYFHFSFMSTDDDFDPIKSAHL